jgi:hypothetical protein
MLGMFLKTEIYQKILLKKKGKTPLRIARCFSISRREFCSTVNRIV